MESTAVDVILFLSDKMWYDRPRLEAMFGRDATQRAWNNGWIMTVEGGLWRNSIEGRAEVERLKEQELMV